MAKRIAAALALAVGLGLVVTAGQQPGAGDPMSPGAVDPGMVRAVAAAAAEAAAARVAEASGSDGLTVAATGAGVVVAVLLGVWRIVNASVNAAEGRLGERLDGVDKRLTAQIGEVRREVGEVNRRIDAVLLADRDAGRAS